jgi:hypothetical protein
MIWRENLRIRPSTSPSTSSGYAQGERKLFLTLSFPFVLSVARRAESKHERRVPSTAQLGKL